MERIIGLLVIAGAYGLTLYLFIKSLRIIEIIDSEKLLETRDILARLRRGKQRRNRGE